MKWYLATNEAGTFGDGGLHSKIAVLSALRNTDLEPHLITTGFDNEHTAWMRERGVKVIKADLTFADVIHSGMAAGTYHEKYLGHWLRTEVCRIEQEDDFVLYTDIDVVFRKQPKLAGLYPKYFSCAPEWRPDAWNYFNSGVMLMNVASLRRTHDIFTKYSSDNIRAHGGEYLDQLAYNQFYRGAWERLSPDHNWKPYWSPNNEATILHFHGPKIGFIKAAWEGQLTYVGEKHAADLASLIASFSDGYVHAVAQMVDALGPDAKCLDLLLDLAAVTRAGPPLIPSDIIDLDIMTYVMFPKGEPPEGKLFEYYASTKRPQIGKARQAFERFTKSLGF